MRKLYFYFFTGYSRYSFEMAPTGNIQAYRNNFCIKCLKDEKLSEEKFQE